MRCVAEMDSAWSSPLPSAHALHSVSLHTLPYHENYLSRDSLTLGHAIPHTVCSAAPTWHQVAPRPRLGH